MRVSPEKMIIHALLNRDTRDRETPRSTLPNDGLNWDHVLALVRRFNVAPLFYHRLKNRRLDGHMPERIKGHLERYYYSVGCRNLQAFEELKTVLGAFNSAGVDVIVLKGAALATEVWKNRSLREMADIDLLVRPGLSQKAEDLLIKMGYRPMALRRSRAQYRQHHHHLIPYRHPRGSRVPLEIHHHIIAPCVPVELDMEGVWQRSRELVLDDFRLRVMCPEDLTVHLCLHQTISNLLNNLRGLLDITETVSRFGPEFRWARIIQAARTPAMNNALFYPLFFSKSFLGARIPQEVLERLERHLSLTHMEHCLLVFLCKRHLFSKKEPHTAVSDAFLSFACREIVVGGGNLDKAKNILQRFLFPEVKPENNAHCDAFRNSDKKLTDYISRSCSKGVRFCRRLMNEA